MRILITLIAFVSVILFPWQFTAFLVLVSSFFVPLLPLAIGIFADTLYYSMKITLVPLYTILGLLVTGIAIFVRTRLQTSTIH